MTMSINAKAQSAFKKLGVVALITATIFFVACKQTGGGGGKPTPKPKHAITFSVDSTTPNGKLKAKADSVPETATSPINVEEGKAVIFTATADAGYRVKEWKVDDTTLAGNNSKIYTHTVTKTCKVCVSFELTPKHAITFGVEGTPPNGTLKAEVEGKTITTGNKVEEGKVVIFTATPDSGCRIGTWSVSPSGAIQSGGGKGDKTVTLKINADTTVSVSFELLQPGKVILSLNRYKLNIYIKAITSDGSAIQVEGCDETTLASNVETKLHAKGTTVILTGIIDTLFCENNELIAINVQGCTSLRCLDCANNYLTYLNVQDCTNLEWLFCQNNHLTTLDVRGLTSLSFLQCFHNMLTILFAQGCTALRKLPCYRNRLTYLDVRGCTYLQKLECYKNQLTSLDVRGCTYLQKLECYENKLTSLNAQGCTYLFWIDCHDNQFTSFDVQGLTGLRVLNCSYNKLTELNEQGLTNLVVLNCSYNKLTELNVQGLTALRELECSANKLTSLNVQGLTSLWMLYCSENKLTELNVQGLTALRVLSCSSNQLTELNVEGCTSLKTLTCDCNKIKAEAMTKLLNALPARSETDYARAVLYTEKTGVTEGNCKDYTQPADLKKAFEDAKKRRWTLKKIDASGNWEDI